LVANGVSGVSPPSLENLRVAAATFPDAGSVNYLRQLGITKVVWLAYFGGGSETWADVPNRPIDGLGITREEINGDLVFRLGG
jgi:hypothetical protein